MKIRAAASPAATPDNIGRRRDRVIYSTLRLISRATAAFGRREKPSEIVGHAGKPVGRVPVAPPGLKQLVRDRQRRQNRGLMRPDHGKRVPNPLEGCIEIRGYLSGVFGGQLRADRVLLTADEDA